MKTIDKETFHKKWYYRLLQIIFWGSFVLISGTLLIISISEEDIPLAGFFWWGVVILIYWLAKRVAYRILFGESIMPPRK